MLWVGRAYTSASPKNDAKHQAGKTNHEEGGIQLLTCYGRLERGDEKKQSRCGKSFQRRSLSRQL